MSFVVALHVVAALVAAVAVAALGAWVARLLRQPPVIGEIVAGIGAGPALIALVGDGEFHALLPAQVLSMMNLCAQCGLVLFLATTTHSLRVRARVSKTATSWTVAGALIVPLICGLALASWLVATDDPVVRGTAPAAGFVLVVAVCMSITAVPVLARLLSDRGISATMAGVLSLTVGIVIDAVGWLLLSIGIGLSSGNLMTFVREMTTLLVAAAITFALRWLLKTGAAEAFCARLPRTAALSLGVFALGFAFAVQQFGLTWVFGAALVGVMVPAGQDSPWRAVVGHVAPVGKALIPMFFVVTGITTLTSALHSAPWGVITVTLVLGIIGKLGGGFVGARLGKLEPLAAVKIGALLNTRGLTELIVLHVGLTAGVLTPALFLAMLVMALTTTAMTGPLLTVIERAEARRAAAVEPAVAA